MLPVNDRWALADPWVRDHIRDLVEYISVRFDDCDACEVAAVYRALAARLIESGRGDVVLLTPPAASEEHYAVRDVFRALLRNSGANNTFRFALCANAPRVKNIFHQVQKEFYRAGFEIRVFEHELEASSWFCADEKPKAGQSP